MSSTIRSRLVRFLHNFPVRLLLQRAIVTQHPWLFRPFVAFTENRQKGLPMLFPSSFFSKAQITRLTICFWAEEVSRKFGGSARASLVQYGGEKSCTHGGSGKLSSSMASGTGTGYHCFTRVVLLLGRTVFQGPRGLLRSIAFATLKLLWDC